MTIFEGLLIAHLLGDWLLQTEWQAQNKQHNCAALMVHVAIYHTVVLAVLVFGFKFTNLETVAVVMALAVLHMILDRRTAVIWIMRRLRLTVERQPERWLLIAVDQSLHLLLLGAAALILSHLTAN